MKECSPDQKWTKCASNSNIGGWGAGVTNLGGTNHTRESIAIARLSGEELSASTVQKHVLKVLSYIY